jgi:hypothetical protein
LQVHIQCIERYRFSQDDVTRKGFYSMMLNVSHDYEVLRYKHQSKTNLGQLFFLGILWRPILNEPELTLISSITVGGTYYTIPVSLHLESRSAKERLSSLFLLIRENEMLFFHASYRNKMVEACHFVFCPGKGRHSKPAL